MKKNILLVVLQLELLVEVEEYFFFVVVRTDHINEDGILQGCERVQVHLGSYIPHVACLDHFGSLLCQDLGELDRQLVLKGFHVKHRYLHLITSVLECILLIANFPF